MLAFLGRAIRAEKAPYVMTVFVAAVAWTSIRTADRLSSVAFIEYELGSPGAGRDQKVEIRLRNITQAAVFPCFIMTVASADPSTLAFGPSEQWDQILRGTVLVQGTPRRAEKDEAEIEIKNFSPGADFALRLPTLGQGSPRLLVRECSALTAEPSSGESKADKKDKPSSGAPPILVHRSLATFFVEWEIAVLWSILAAWGVALAVALSLRKTEPPIAVVVSSDGDLNDEEGSLD
jgi:hypothetical protein